MPAPSPDLAGFADAQRRLRDGFGEQITFLQDAVVTFPPNTVFDPESGEPMDPTIVPTASAQASAAVKCDVYFRAISRGGTGKEEIQTPAGIFPSSHLMLIADITDRATCEPCNECIVRGDRMKIETQKPDGIGAVQRWLVYVRRGP